MSKFNINKLVVLHLYNYIKPSGQRDPLTLIENACQGVRISTCMRIVLVLNTDALVTEEQLKAYASLTDFLDKKDNYSAAIFFERLNGVKAYEFLLYWMIGGINPKRTFDDCRIIGDVRSIWNKITGSTGYKSQILTPVYTGLFNILFADTVQLYKLIDIYNELNIGDLVNKLQTATKNCAWARLSGFLSCLNNFNYAHFAEGTYLEEMKRSLECMKQALLSKVTQSPSGEITFFQSNYEVTKNTFEGIKTRLETISQLLVRLQGLIQDKVEDKENNEPVDIKTVAFL